MCQYVSMHVHDCVCVNASAYLLTVLLLTAGTEKDEGASALNVFVPTISYGQKKAWKLVHDNQNINSSRLLTT